MCFGEGEGGEGGGIVFVQVKMSAIVQHSLKCSQYGLTSQRSKYDYHI